MLSRTVLPTALPSLQTEIHWYGWAAMIFYLCSLGFYLWVRITKTLNLGPGYIWYGIYLLVVEVLGATTVVLYGEQSSIANLAAAVAKGLCVWGCTPMPVFWFLDSSFRVWATLLHDPCVCTRLMLQASLWLCNTCRHQPAVEPSD